MKSSRPTDDEAHAAWSADERAFLERLDRWSPTTDALIAYARGQLDDDERALIDDYLAAHPDEAELVALMRANAPDEPDALPPRLSVVASFPAPLSSAPPELTARHLRKPAWMWAASVLLALLFGAVAGDRYARHALGSAKTLDLHGTAHTAVYELMSSAWAPTRSADAAHAADAPRTTLTLAERLAFATFSLTTPIEHARVHSIALRSAADGNVVARWHEPVVDTSYAHALGGAVTYTVLVSRAQLAPASYQLLLEDAAGATLDRFAFVIADADRAPP
ncbi:MAG: hypothetical protein AAF772_12300 [Acidobacteriota bacterium]